MHDLRDAYIFDAVRTPVGKHAGSLSNIRADDLAAWTIRKIIERNSTIPGDRIDDVFFGCANQAGEDNRNVARMALLIAGIPASVPGETVNRLCASGMSAVVHASRAIRLGDGDLYIAGGVEHMTRAPFVLSKPEAAFSRKAEIFDSSFGWRFVNPVIEKLFGIDSMGNTAENVAEMYNINRDDQDIFAFNSQKKAAAAEIGDSRRTSETNCSAGSDGTVATDCRRTDF